MGCRKRGTDWGGELNSFLDYILQNAVDGGLRDMIHAYA
jgi:hypothetical protein